MGCQTSKCVLVAEGVDTPNATPLPRAQGYCSYTVMFLTKTKQPLDFDQIVGDRFVQCVHAGGA